MPKLAVIAATTAAVVVNFEHDVHYLASGITERANQIGFAIASNEDHDYDHNDHDDLIRQAAGRVMRESSCSTKSVAIRSKVGPRRA